jgi:hypothetical protein
MMTSFSPFLMGDPERRRDRRAAAGGPTTIVKIAGGMRMLAVRRSALFTASRYKGSACLDGVGSRPADRAGVERGGSGHALTI